MREDVVELAGIPIEIAEVPLAQHDIPQLEIGDNALPLGDGGGGKIDAEISTFGKKVRHRDQVAAVSAAELQDAASRHIRGIHTEQYAGGGKAVRMRLDPR